MRLVPRSLIGGIMASFACLIAAGPAQAASTVTFGFTGSEQTFLVPPGVTSLHANVIGGRGGTSGSELGGFGGLASADFAVNPGQVIYIEVGGNGGGGQPLGGGNAAEPLPGVKGGEPQSPGIGGTGGFNGGGPGGTSDQAFGGSGGGGASEVRTASLVADLSTLAPRLIVAGGGGGSGGGDNGSTTTGGAGGAAGAGGSQR